MPGLEGSTFGHHQLKYLLGRGGMAEVYLAHDDHLFRDVAIKVVHTGRTEHFARFRREAETIGPLAHNHILPVFEYGEQDDWHYLVMPYAAYGTLADLLKKRGALSPEEAGTLLEQIASALQFAHERGVLHRDIKPSNILLRDDHYAYLADFGIAKSQDEINGLTQVGTVIGTPEYMAPELLEEPASPSSDIYALGIVLYQMLTGKVPFEGKTALAVLHKHVQEPPLRPSVINPAIAPAIEQVILSAIEKDPRRRFRTSETLAKAYKQALHTSTASPQINNASPLILRSPAGTMATSASQATVQTPLQAGLPVPPYASYMRQPAGKSRKIGRLVSIGFAAVIVLILLVLLLPNLLSNHTNSQGHTGTQTATTPTTTIPTSTPAPTSTTVTNVCPDQSQVTVNDTANVLDTTQICSAVSQWPYTLTIYTTNTSSQEGNLSDTAQSLLTNANTVVMAIGIDNSHDHPRPHISIIGGDSVQISNTRYHRAVEAFTRKANTGDYTNATIAAIQVLQADDQNT
ncbi:MAG: serine/threonine-protein kinase [Ktedonobacteraceae bacterium]